MSDEPQGHEEVVSEEPIDVEDVTDEPPDEMTAEQPEMPAEPPAAEETVEPEDEGPVEPPAEPEVEPAEQVAEEPTPEPEPEPAAAELEPEPEPEPAEEVEAAFPAGNRAPWWPFLVYDGLWLVFAGLLVWRMLQVPSGVAVYEASEYPLFLLGGLVLAGAGPVLLISVWLAAKRSALSAGLFFISALYRGSAATLLGVIIWWIALLIVDQLRLGRLL